MVGAQNLYAQDNTLSNFKMQIIQKKFPFNVFFYIFKRWIYLLAISDKLNVTSNLSESQSLWQEAIKKIIQSCMRGKDQDGSA